MKKRRSIISMDVIINYDKKEYGMTMLESHSHNVYELYILLDGHRTLVLDQISYYTQANTVSLITPGTYHRSYGDDAYEGICITFSREYLAKFFHTGILDKVLGNFHYPCITLEDSVIKELKYLCTKLSLGESNNYLYLMCILDFLSNCSLISNAKHPNSSNMSIKNYITEHFLEYSNLEQLSKDLYLSKNYICKKFKENEGKTISNYINELKITYACTLLTESSLSITDISQSCNFQSLSYFNKTFKKYTLVSPSDFRKQYTYDIHKLNQNKLKEF